PGTSQTHRGCTADPAGRTGDYCDTPARLKVNFHLDRHSLDFRVDIDGATAAKKVSSTLVRAHQLLSLYIRNLNGIDQEFEGHKNGVLPALEIPLAEAAKVIDQGHLDLRFELAFFRHVHNTIADEHFRHEGAHFPAV